MRDEGFLDVAATISDGAGIEWSVIEGRARSDDERRHLRRLRLVDDIVTFHRVWQSQVDELGDPIDATSPDAPSYDATWGPLGLLERIGQGSFGVVYRAWDPKLEREVALKLSPAGADPARAATISREGRRLARVDHPNVVTVYGAADDDGRAGIWMELIDGITLQDQVKRDGPMSEREVIAIGQDLCGGLAAIHGARLLHRDIKAANVMRERGGRIVLMDLGCGLDTPTGVAPAARDARSTSSISGTPMYMAPELFDGAEASFRSDVYGLGMLLYFLATGTYPVEAITLGQLTDALKRGEQRRLRDVRPDLSYTFVQVIERAIALDPAGRYASAGELDDALGRVLSSDLDRSGRAATLETPAPTGSPAPTDRPARRGRIATLALAAAVVAAIVLWRWAPWASGYVVDATFYRQLPSGAVEALAMNDRVQPKEQFLMRAELSDETWVYVINQDDHGESYLLFPMPGLEQTNPLPAGRHELPGVWLGESIRWQFSSAGGRERLLLVTSPEPLTDFEGALAALPAPRADGELRAAQLSPESVRRLRGAGAIARHAPGAASAPPEILEMAEPLTGRERSSGLRVREIVLENPVDPQGDGR